MRFAQALRTPLVVVALIVLLCQCARTTPEQQLRNSVSALQSAIKARDAAQVKRGLADDFIGPDGLDRAAAARLAQLMFLRNPEVGARIGPLQIDWFPSRAAPDTAAVRFTAVLTGGTGRLLPDQAQVYQVQTGWRRTGDAWLLTSATWKP